MKQCYLCGSPFCLYRARDGYRYICSECQDDITLRIVGVITRKD